MKASFFTESILYWLARAASRTAQVLSPALSVKLGSWMGRQLPALFSHRRAVALGNLRAAFGSSYSPREYEKILQGLFSNLGMTFMEIARIPRIDRAYVDRWITVPPESWKNLEAGLSYGRGVIFLAAHFGNWELAPIVGALHGYPSLVLAREQGWPRLNGLLNQYRESKGCQVVTKGFPIRELIRGLEQGRIAGILSDQDGGHHGVLAPFFGRLASTAPGAIALSINTGAPVLPVFTVRSLGPAHTMWVERPLTLAEGGSLEDRLQRGIAAYLKVLEQYVRRTPTQWLWLHRRWKSSPERRVLLFSDGKQGHFNQLKSFAQRLEAAWEIKAKTDKRLKGIHRSLVRIETVEIAYRNPFWRAALTLVSTLAPRRWTGGDRWLRLSLTPGSYDALKTAYADYSVSCGASTAPVNLLWAWGIGVKAIQINRSGLPSWRRFHLALIPRHDGPPQGGSSNPLVIDGALGPLAKGVENGQVKRWQDSLGLRKSQQVGLLLGGPAKGVGLDLKEVRQMVTSLLRACELIDAEILVTSSRRTPPAVEAWLRQMLENHPRCRLLVLVNQQRSDGLKDSSEAVPCILELSQALVVSGDSISMVSEALTYPKPVISFLPAINGFSLRTPKYHRFLRELDQQGRVKLTRPEKAGEALLEAMNGQGEEVLTPHLAGDPVVEHLLKWL